MKKLMTAGLVAAALGVGGTAAEAQGILPVAVEVRGGYAVPTGDLGDSDVDDGLGFGVNAQLAVMPMLSVYGGWERYSFGIDTGSSDADADVVDSGFRVGLQAGLPFTPFIGVSPFVFAGGIYNSTSLEGSSGGVSVSLDSDRSLGYELGGGLAIPVGPALQLTPAVRYRSHSVEFDDTDSDSDMSYFTAEIGLRLGL